MHAYTADQEDALKEIANIGMGQAGAALAKVLGEFVVLSVPAVRLVTATEVGSSIIDLSGARGDAPVIVMRQGFSGEIHGEALVLFDETGCTELADLLGHDGVDGADVEQELLLDTTNIVTAAVLNGLVEQLNTPCTQSAPTPFARGTELEQALQPDSIGWHCALLIEVNFRLEQRNFLCHLVLLMPESAIGRMGTALDRVLESL